MTIINYTDKNYGKNTIKSAFMLVCLSFVIFPGRLSAQSLFLSYNARTPKETGDIKHDYHIAGGISRVKPFNALRLKYERENGKYYGGVLVETMKTPEIAGIALLEGHYLKYLTDTAKDINELYLFKEYFNVFDILSLRTANRWEDWKYKGFSVGVKLDLNIGKAVTELSYDTDFYLLHLFQFSYRVRFNTSRGYFEPYYRYRSEPSSFEGGIEMGRRL